MGKRKALAQARVLLACVRFSFFAKRTVGSKCRCIVHSHLAEGGICCCLRGMKYTTRPASLAA